MNPNVIQEPPSITWNSVKHEELYTVFMGGMYTFKAEFIKLLIFENRWFWHFVGFQFLCMNNLDFFTSKNVMGGRQNYLFNLFSFIQ